MDSSSADDSLRIVSIKHSVLKLDTVPQTAALPYYGRLASVQGRLDHFADAMAELGKGRHIMAALVAVAPGNAQWKKDLDWFDSQIARIEGQAQKFSGEQSR